MAQAVTCQHLTAEAQIHMEFLVDKVALDRFFSKIFSLTLSMSFRWGILIYDLSDKQNAR
jgi:hypothetical protein